MECECTRPVPNTRCLSVLFDQSEAVLRCRGSFIGIDGAEHTPGNLWGHIHASDIILREGNHEFETLGFEDCCDGHAELEVHFPCDRPESGASRTA